MVSQAKSAAKQSKSSTGTRRRLLTLALWGCLLGFSSCAGAWYWYHHRPMPDSMRRTLFPGVVYFREVRHTPRPMVIHVVRVRLDTPGLSFLVTPGKPTEKRPLKARTTSQFLTEFGAQVAINGDFFFPWHSRSLWDYYPHVGDPVEVQGFASSRGVVYSDSHAKRQFPTLYLSRENRASFHQPVGPIYNALSGAKMLIEQGKAIPVGTSNYFTDLHPRTAIGLDRAEKTLILILVDGRQPNYSEGATIGELTDIAREYGAYSALNLDGGGSTTLVAETRPHNASVLNSPIDNRIPGRERPVANHLGIFIRNTTARR